jgi:hypothetical protein
LLVAALLRQARHHLIHAAPAALVRAGREPDDLSDLEFVTHAELLSA